MVTRIEIGLPDYMGGPLRIHSILCSRLAQANKFLEAALKELESIIQKANQSFQDAMKDKDQEEQRQVAIVWTPVLSALQRARKIYSEDTSDEVVGKEGVKRKKGERGKKRGEKRQKT